MTTQSKMILTSAWRKWLVENLQQGCTQAALIESMMQNNFSYSSAVAYIAEVAAAHAINIASDKPVASGNFIYEGSRIAQGNTIQLTDQKVNVSLRVDQPDIVVVDNFLTPEECETLIALSKVKLERSEVIDPVTGESVIIHERSSEGCYFQREEDEFIKKLDTRISELMNWPVENGEGIQILHYSLGGEYRPHFDYFPVEQTGSAQHIAKGGQRVATLVMYLNNVESGGETIFPEVGLKVVPRQGSAVYFSYCNSLGQIDPATLHGGEPIITGDKWIATKWMRQNSY